MSPTFSVILPTAGRRPAMLNRAINSVYRQTDCDFELIVVEDGENVHGPELRSTWQGYPHLYWAGVSHNRGVARARNMGIAAASGKYISFLDDDDEYLPTFIASTRRLLEDSPDDVGVSFCGVKYIDYHPVTREPLNEPRFRSLKIEYADLEKIIKEFLSLGCGCGVTFKKSTLQAIGGFDAAFQTGEDTDLFYRCLASGYLPVSSGSVEISVHNHSEQRLTDASRTVDRIEACSRILETYGAFLNSHPALRAGLEGHRVNLTKRLERELTGN